VCMVGFYFVGNALSENSKQSTLPPAKAPYVKPVPRPYTLEQVGEHKGISGDKSIWIASEAVGRSCQFSFRDLRKFREPIFQCRSQRKDIRCVGQVVVLWTRCWISCVCRFACAWRRLCGESICISPGRDATRGLALTSLDVKDVDNSSIAELTDLSTLNEWIASYESKYDVIGWVGTAAGT
jgi:hypothetical protein